MLQTITTQSHLFFMSTVSKTVALGGECTQIMNKYLIKN